jgi:DNA-directed RNA polymerase specialized sigma24 family protein
MNPAILSIPWSPAMNQEIDLVEWMQRLRAGDESAAAWLLQQFEPEIRRLIRVRLQNSGLRRILDSVDICQEALFAFVQYLDDNNVNPRSTAEIMQLLITIAQNKLRDEIRKTRSLRRGQGRSAETEPGVLGTVMDGGANPSELAADRDLLAVVQGQMTETERWIVEQRALGHDWKTLAEKSQSTPAALRRRVARMRQRLHDKHDLTRC